MALIPGTLPSDTCYGTPQDLLELFAQYLDVPAFALNSKVVFSSSNSGLTADVIWFNTTSVTNPILSINVSGWVDYITNYTKNATTVTAATGDYVLIQDVSDSDKTKKTLVSSITALAVPSSGSITYPMLSTSATEANNAAKRTAKAWVYFDASGTITNAFNVTSVTATYGGLAGRYLITFTANVTNPVLNYTARSVTPGSQYCHQFIESVSSGSVIVYNVTDIDGRASPSINCVVVFGDS